MTSVFVTGATGFLGSTVLARLVASRYHVTALVRTAAGADAVRHAGGDPVLGTLADHALLADAARSADAVIHTAASDDGDPGARDARFVATMIEAIGGSARPYVHSGGAWVFGSGTGLTERSPHDPPPVTTWRVPVEEAVRASSLLSTIIAPGLIHDDAGRGLISVLRPGADGVARTVGDGTQHWTTVHVDDLADLYVRAIEAALDDRYYFGVAACHTVRALTEAAAGEAPVVAETAADAVERFGAPLASGLLLDQVTAPSAAIAELGWTPSGATAPEVLRVGSTH